MGPIEKDTKAEWILLMQKEYNVKQGPNLVLKITKFPCFIGSRNLPTYCSSTLGM